MSTKPKQNQYEEAYKSLVKGLKELDLRGPCVPSDLVLNGDHAFPLAMNSRGQVLMAASQYGSGRIVVLGHEGYLTTSPALVKNALTWLRGDESHNLAVGVQNNIKAVADIINKSDFQVKIVEAFSSSLGVGVYVTDAYSVGADPKELVAFMKAGGGVLIGGQAWHWSHTHPRENTLLQFAGNKVAGVAGIYFTEVYGEAECLPVSPLTPSSWMAVKLGKNFDDDLKFLLKGVSQFDLNSDSVLSEVLVHGPLAFPIGTTKDGQPFLAGAYYGRGRVIVVTHEAFLQSEKMATFWTNALHWLDQGRQGLVGVQDAGLKILSMSGLKCKNTNFSGDLSVFVCTAYRDGPAKEIQDFVAEGGGLLIGGHAWYWTYSHAGENLMTDFSGNKVLSKMGLSLLGATVSNDVYKAPENSQAIKDDYFFRHLLHRFLCHAIEGEKLKHHEKKRLGKLGIDCAHYLRLAALDWPSYAMCVSVLTDVLLKSGMPQVSESRPVKKPDDLLLLSLGSELYKVCPDPDALLPHLIKNIPSLPVVEDQKIKINANTEGREEWISTGLYLSPGMKTKVTIPAQLVNSGWEILIGCQTDQLNAEELKRAPSVCERFLITSKMMEVRNLWGGLIYLIAPSNTRVEGTEVIVQRAVLAPYYKSGVTTSADWSVLRTAPSPWAEFEFDNIILTVQSEFVRVLEHPDKLAALWNDIMKAIADLGVIPHKFPRKERFVTDVQISAGWMHTGYPIMAHRPSADEVVNMETIRREGMWGPIHELGHHQQRSCWEFPPHTGECTNNLWSVYVHEEVLGINRAKAHSALTAESRKSSIEDYVKRGRDLNNWNVWVALETYLQLQEKFGWGAFKKVFAGYHEMKNVPGDNKRKMNLYAETFSRAVGMNLTGFFKAWGWPIETATEEILSNLPPWTDHPMA